MKLRYTIPASRDLDGILAHLSGQSAQGALRVANRLKAAERLIAAFPRAGARTRLRWLRRMKVSRYPYLIFYEISDDEVVIHAVRHTSREPLLP